MADGQDHLSNEISISAKLTPDGVEAKSKSRLLSALDRLGGSYLDRFAAKQEGRAAITRAETAGQEKIIAAAAQKATDRMNIDSGFADGLIEHHFGRVAAKQNNVDGALLEAIKDLRNDPPSEQQNGSGAEAVAPETLDRLEFFLEQASTDELRQKWGRVLSAEIRAPGTVTNKVMRIVDELDAETAKRFEEFYTACIGSTVPTILKAPDFLTSTALIGAGLLIDPGLGISRSFGRAKRQDGVDVWLLSFGQFALICEGFDLAALNGSDHFSVDDGVPGIQINELTPEGRSLGQILPSASLETAKRLVEAIRPSIPTIKLYRSNGENFEPVPE